MRPAPSFTSPRTSRRRNNQVQSSPASPRQPTRGWVATRTYYVSAEGEEGDDVEVCGGAGSVNSHSLNFDLHLMCLYMYAFGCARENLRIQTQTGTNKQMETQKHTPVYTYTPVYSFWQRHLCFALVHAYVRVCVCACVRALVCVCVCASACACACV